MSGRESFGERAPAKGAGDAQVHMPDDMGAHSEDGVVWLPRALYPERNAARKWYADFMGVPWIEVSVLARWMRHAPEHEHAAEYSGEFWMECDRDAPGAFQAWRCE